MRSPKTKAGRPRTARAHRAPTAEALPPEAHERSLTAVAADAMRAAVPPAPEVRASDPDQSLLENDDYNAVDEVGRVYGVQEEDSGALRSSSEILDGRDRHRSELIPPRVPED